MSLSDNLRPTNTISSQRRERWMALHDPTLPESTHQAWVLISGVGATFRGKTAPLCQNSQKFRKGSEHTGIFQFEANMDDTAALDPVSTAGDAMHHRRFELGLVHWYNPGVHTGKLTQQSRRFPKSNSFGHFVCIARRAGRCASISE